MPGLHFEEMEVGKVYRHEITRTVTEMDNVLFSCLTMNPQPLHLDEEFSKKTVYGTRIVNGLFTLALTISMGVSEMTMGTMLGNLSYEGIDFPAAVLHGDTLRGETIVTKKRESKSMPGAGIVWFEHRSFNQHGKCVCVCRRVGLVKRRVPTAGKTAVKVVGKSEVKASGKSATTKAAKRASPARSAKTVGKKTAR